GWERDQLEVGDILDKYGLKSLYAFNKSEKTRGVPIRFHPKNGRSVLTYNDGSVVSLDGDPKDSLIKPITRILVGVAVLTALIVLVMKETPEWAKKLNITGIDFSVPPCCVNPQLLYKKTVFALFPTVAILMVHVYFCTVDASIGVQVTSETGMVGTETQPSILIQIVQVIIAMFVMDTWQYFVHRYMHINKFLYRHIHSQHHRLVVPYAIGALYNHPLEGLLLDTVGGAISFLISGMTARTAVIFFCFATVKTVDDHCRLWLLGNLFHMLFQNNTAYHDVHHQLHGLKYNFSQPFFPIWDKLLGTYMPYDLVKRAEGGRHPTLKWAQRADVIFITIDLPDAKDVKFKLEPEGKFYFSATAGADNVPYEIDVNLHDKVDVNESKSSVGSRTIVYLIKKEESKWWNRLLKQEGKTPPFVKVDWDKWVDEDEQDEKADMDFGDIDFSQNLNMGGGEGFDAEGDEDDSDTEEEVKEEEAIGKQEGAPRVGNQVEATT
ncbi:sphinganine C4-monooxygenase 1-like protein, partial [Tanacetum coccineum]